MSRKRMDYKILIAVTLSLLFIISILLRYLFRIEDTLPYSVLWFMGFSLVLLLVKHNTLAKREFFFHLISDLIAIGYLLFLLRNEDLTNPSFLTESKNDERAFWSIASMYLEGDFRAHLSLYPYILYFEFLVFGKNYLCCALLNVFLVQIMKALFCINIKKIVESENIRAFSSAIICFFPYSFLISVHLYREAIYIFLTFLSFWFYSRYILENKETYFLFAAALILSVVYMHIGYIAILIIYAIGYIHDQKDNPKRIYRIIPMLVVLIAAFLLSWRSTAAETYFKTGSSANLLEATLARLGTQSGEVARAGSTYLRNIRIHNVWQLILFTPVKTFYYLFSPLPMNWRGLSDIVAFMLDSVFHIIIIIGALKVLLKPKRYSLSTSKYRILMASFMIVLFSAVIFGLGTSTAGTALRHRDSLIGIEGMILALVLEAGVYKTPVLKID